MTVKDKKTKRNHPQNFDVCDGSGISMEEEVYGTDDYLNFLSNGTADNEKIDAVDYFEEFLSENTQDDKQ